MKTRIFISMGMVWRIDSFSSILYLLVECGRRLSLYFTYTSREGEVTGGGLKMRAVQRAGTRGDGCGWGGGG